MDISEDDFCSLVEVESGDVREDIRLPEIPLGLSRGIRANFDGGKSLIVSVLSAMGIEQIIAFKEEV